MNAPSTLLSPPELLPKVAMRVQRDAMSDTALSPEEIERYARHLVLPEIGGTGQQKLKAAKVLIVGAGGLGAPTIQYLAAAGVGHLTIVDDDVVSLSNLQRQVIHATVDVGLAKVESAAADVRRLNPHVNVTATNARLKKRTQNHCSKGRRLHSIAATILQPATRWPTPAMSAKITLVSAAVNRFDGSITTLSPWKDNNPSYRDLFPAPPPNGVVPTCAEAGIMGAVTGMLGTMQALEAIKAITGTGEILIGKLFMINGLTMQTQTIRYKKRSIVREPKAYIFDVFGTLVDWRSSVAREAGKAFESKGLHVDHIAFAEAWRGEYQPAMERIRSGNRGYIPLDDLHRENLDIILKSFDIESAL